MLGIVKSNYWTDFKELANAYHPKLRNVLTPFVTNSDMMALATAKITKDGDKSGGIQSSTGKLSFKEEAAGKLRVFAIVDGLTQWLLYPLHKLIFKVLKYIPMDGTFNQLRPLHRLLRLKAKSFYSLDLSAATDRLPLAIQEHLLNEWFSAVPNFGTHWANILVKRAYRYFVDPNIGYKFKKEFGFLGSVHYKVGQPMGALSSWAMLALTHHFLVQVSAWRIGFVKPGKLYTNYALLGDDLVIVDKPVAKSYIWLMTKIGVAINLNKSILSPSGKGLEFAKRTFIDGMDVSPISLRDLSLSLVPGNVSNWVAFAKSHSLDFFAQAKILGYGFSAIKPSFRKLNHALKVVYLANIAKIDINSQVLSLRAKLPVDLNVNVPLFKQQVLQPIFDDLKAGFQISGDDWDNDYGIAVLDVDEETRFESILYNTPYYVIDWATAHPEMFKSSCNEMLEFTSKSFEEVQAIVLAGMKSNAFHLTKDEAPYIISQLQRTLFGFDIDAIRTFDECLSCYLIVTKMKAIQDIAIHKLDPKVKITRQAKLPYQVKLFRGWSKIILRTVKSNNKTT